MNTAVKDMTLDGKAYKLVPVEEYNRLLAAGNQAGAVEAMAYARSVIAADLLKARQDAGMTQQELADASGVPKRTISRIECGDVRKPQIATMDKLWDALGVE